MQSSNTPSRIPLPFASDVSALKNTIPENSADAPNPNNASYQLGFPPITMLPIESGGLPFYGQDMNGILNALSSAARWANAGGLYKYDATFANDTNVGGYPKGALLIKAGLGGFWFNTVENNTSNPDTGGAGWVDLATILTNIPTQNSITGLRSQSKIGPSFCFVSGYYVSGDGGGGIYYYDPADLTSIDNGGTIIVASDGGRWKLALTGPVSVKQFGAKGDFNGTTGADDTAAIQACINWVQANTNSAVYGSYSPSVGTGVVYFPQGSYKITAPLVVSTKICIMGEGQTEYTYGSRLTQTVASADMFQIGASAGSTSFSIEDMVLRHNTAAGAGNLVNMVRSGGGTVNSQRYVNCTFSQPAAKSLYLAGDDIVIKNCLFDVSTQSGDCIQLGTATMGASNVRIEGCDFFNASNSCVKLINVSGLTVNGNTLSQPNSTTKTPYFIDGMSTTPTLAQNITVCGNTIRGPRAFVALAGTQNLTISGNTVTEGGIGSGEALNMLWFSGSCPNVAITGNTFRGSYDTKNFYNDSSATSVTGVISGNSFYNNGGAGDALSCTKFSGRLLPNFFAGFVNRQMGEKRATTGSPVNPGAIAAGATFGYAVTVAGANFGDGVSFGTINNAWLAQTGIDVVAFVNNTNAVRIEYRNSTTSSITVPAHDIWVEVTR